MPEPHEVFAAEQAAAWGQYVANQPIFIGGARAANTGDAIPASLVESGVVRKELVDRVANKTEAKAAAKDVS